MRLAIVIQSYGRYGGAERAAVMNYNQLRRCGKDVDIFASDDVKAVIPEAKLLSKMSFLHENVIKQFREYDSVLVHHHIEPSLAFRLTRELRNVSWYSGSLFEPVYSEEVYGTRYETISTTLKDTMKSYYGVMGTIGYYGFPLAKRVFKAVDRITVGGYQSIICNSKWQARLIKKVYGRESMVVYPPVDSTPYDGPAGWQPDKPYAMMVGAFIPLKNFEAGIKAMRNLNGSHALVMVGQGTLRFMYQNLADKLGVEIHFVGMPPRSDLQRLFGQSDFVMCPSHFEGFGLVPIEAAYFRKPSVVTTNSGVAEIFEDGVSAFKAAPDDSKTLGNAVKALGTDDGLRQEMGESAYRSASSLFSDGQSRRLWEVLEN